MINLNVIYEDNHLLIVEKPINIPMQEDSSKDMDMLRITKKYLIEKYNKKGDAYVGLVHRLDRPVGGIVIFAKTSKAASRLSEMIAKHNFKKEYLAVVLDNGLRDSGTFEDYLLKDSRTNTTYIDPKGKFASLDYEVIARKNNLALVHINLHTGRSHQIRVQFASRNHALYGDQRYNKKAVVGEQIALFAYRITFAHPVTKEEMEFTLEPKDIYPFNIGR